MAKSQDGAFVGQPTKGWELCKVSLELRFQEGLLDRLVTQVEPLQHEVVAQHGVSRKWWEAHLAFTLVRGYEIVQVISHNHFVNLIKEYLLARFTHDQFQFKAGLFHGFKGCHLTLTPAKFS